MIDINERGNALWVAFYVMRWADNKKFCKRLTERQLKGNQCHVDPKDQITYAQIVEAWNAYATPEDIFDDVVLAQLAFLSDSRDMARQMVKGDLFYRGFGEDNATTFVAAALLKAVGHEHITPDQAKEAFAACVEVFKK